MGPGECLPIYPSVDSIVYLRPPRRRGVGSARFVPKLHVRARFQYTGIHIIGTLAATASKQLLYVQGSMNRAWYLLIDCHGGAAAYAHRNAPFKMQFYDRTYFGDYDPKWFGVLNGWC